MAQARTPWIHCRCCITAWVIRHECWIRRWTISSPSSLSKTVLILGVHVLYHTFFDIILCMALQYSCYSNISVTVTLHGSQKFYPFLCSKVQTNPQRSSLWHLWALDDIKSNEWAVTEMLSSLPHYVSKYLCLPWQTNSPEHQWSHSKQGSPNLRKDLLSQGMREDDNQQRTGEIYQHSTGEDKPSKNKSIRLATLMLTLLIEYLVQAMQKEAKLLWMTVYFRSTYITLLSFYSMVCIWSHV